MAAAERARLLMEQAEALGEPPEDAVLLFSALFALFNANLAAFDGDVARERAAQILALAEKQGGKVLLTRGHSAMGVTSVLTGNFAEAIVHYDQVLALYDPVEHRPLATRFIQDPRVAALIWRSRAMWALGYPEAAFAGTERALREARETGNPASLKLPWRCAKAKVTQTIGPATPRVLALPRAGAGSPGGDLRPPPSGRFSNDWR
jgi:hypothetical protein